MNTNVHVKITIHIDMIINIDNKEYTYKCKYISKYEYRYTCKYRNKYEYEYKYNYK